MLGPNAGLYFEDRLTIQYQVQEMLRLERIFERSAIDEEIEACNPLIPDGTNWMATFMLEHPNVEERRLTLSQLGGVERLVWSGLRPRAVLGSPPLPTIANEDMERTNDHKTAAVHFLRFELDAASLRALKAGGALFMGIDYPALSCCVEVPQAT